MMNSPIVNACLPWAICIVVAFVVARILVWMSGAKLKMGKLKSIHACQEGSVQSLSFVLTLPFFVMIVMLIVQASHIMIGNILVQYSAFAAARSAQVWIPANYQFETANCISSIQQIGQDERGVQYRITPDFSSPKYHKIHSAAVMANFSLGPSRDLGYQLPSSWLSEQEAIVNLFRGLDPEAFGNARFEPRVRNKLAYSVANTSVDLTFWHRWTFDSRWEEPPLQRIYFYDRDGDYEFKMNELGWQDHLTAEVRYNLPLLPGPVRLFARHLQQNNAIETRDQSGEVYIWPLFAVATMNIEGHKPVKEYWQEAGQ